mmetsp:Transcript_44766/g.127837  ORF Transcript_44766/g.127837 Transcript_44766/m.127837 type:complete len:203 (+) Transcript_44766:371-979(+)
MVCVNVNERWQTRGCTPTSKGLRKGVRKVPYEHVAAFEHCQAVSQLLKYHLVIPVRQVRRVVIALPYVDVGVNEVESRGGGPVAEQPQREVAAAHAQDHAQAAWLSGLEEAANVIAAPQQRRAAGSAGLQHPRGATSWAHGPRAGWRGGGARHERARRCLGLQAASHARGRQRSRRRSSAREAQPCSPATRSLCGLGLSEVL